MHAKVLDDPIHLLFGHRAAPPCLPDAYPTILIWIFWSLGRGRIVMISMAPRAGVKPKRTELELVGFSGLPAGAGGADTVTDTVRSWEETVAATHGMHRWNRDRSWSAARACRRRS